MAENKEVIVFINADEEDIKIAKLFHYLWKKAKEGTYEKSVWMELQKLLNKKGINV